MSTPADEIDAFKQTADDAWTSNQTYDRDSVEKAIKIGEANPNDEDYFLHFKLGSLYLDQLDHDDQIKPEAIQAIAEKALAALQKGWQMYTSDDAFAGKEDENIANLYLIAEAQLKLKKYDEVIQTCEKVWNINQNQGAPELVANIKRDAIMLKGRTFQEQSKFLQAVQEYTALEQFVNLKKDIPYENIGVLYTNRGMCYMRLKDKNNYEQAIKDLHNAFKADPTNHEIAELLAQAYQQQNQIPQAIKVLDDVTALFKGKPDKVNKLVEILIAKGNIQKLATDAKIKDQALSTYQEADKLQPDNMKVKLAIGNLAFKKQDWDEAIKTYTYILSKDANNVDALNNRGTAYKEKGDLVNARNDWQQCVSISKTEISAMINLASITEKVEDSEKLYRDAIAIDKSNAHAYNGLGICLKKQNKYPEAEEAYHQCVTLDPKYILGYCNMAQVQQLQKKDDKQAAALVSLNKASTLLLDEQVKETLNPKLIAFIQTSIQKIKELDEKFGKQARDMEEQIKQLERVQASPQEIEAYKNKYLDMQKKLDEIAAARFENMQANAQHKETEIEKQMSAMEEEQKRMRVQMAEQEERIKRLDQYLKNIQELGQSLSNRITAATNLMQQAGFYEVAGLKQWFKKNEGTPKYRYCKAFYWTILNYFDAFSAASTGVLQTNKELTIGKDEENKAKGMKIAGKVVGKAAELTSGIPIIGSIFSLLDSAMGPICEAIQEKSFEDKMNSITKIIQENHTANSKEDMSATITKAAQNIADQKEEKKVFEAIADKKKADEANKKFFGKALDYITNKVAEIKALALGKKIELYDSIEGAEALKDVILCLAFMKQQYQMIIDNSKKIPLDQQIFYMVTEKDCYNILLRFKQPEKETPLDVTVWQIPPDPELQAAIDRANRPPEQVQQVQQVQQAEVQHQVEPPKQVEPQKAEPPKQVEPPKQAEAPKQVEPPKQAEAPKAEPPKQTEAQKQAAQPQQQSETQNLRSETQTQAEQPVKKHEAQEVRGGNQQPQNDKQEQPKSNVQQAEEVPERSSSCCVIQ